MTQVITTTVAVYGIQPSDFLGSVVLEAFQRGVALAVGCHRELVHIAATESLSLEKMLEQASVNPLEEVDDCYPDGGLACKLEQVRKLPLKYPIKMYIEGFGTAVDITIARPRLSTYPPIDAEQVRQLLEQGLTQEAHKRQYGAVHNNFLQRASAMGAQDLVSGTSSRMIYRPIVVWAHAWSVPTLDAAIDVFCETDDRSMEGYVVETIKLAPGTYVFSVSPLALTLTLTTILTSASSCSKPWWFRGPRRVAGVSSNSKTQL